MSTNRRARFAHQTYSGEPQSAADLASGRVGNNLQWDQADIANPAWQQYTLGQVFQNMAATGSNAWFADSFTYGLGGAGYDGTIPTRYQSTNAANPADWPGGITWTTQLGNWAQVIETAFAQHNATYGTDYKFIPNLDARATSWEPNWYNNAAGVPIVDGAFLEGFGQYTDTYDWTLSMNRGLNLTSNGKIVIMQPYPSSAPNTAAGQQQIDFFVGSYLLLKGDQTYLNIDYGGGVQYYPQYQLTLGTASAPPPSNVSTYLWNGVYRRDFQNGFALVNPGTTSHTLNLGGAYQQMHGQGGGTMADSQIDSGGNYTGGSLSYASVSSVTLAGGTAAIFLKPAAVSAVTVNAGMPQRSMVTSLAVTFNTQVGLPVTATSAFSLTRIGDGAAVSFTATAAVVNSATVVTLGNFSGAATEDGSLADGRYTLTVLASQVTANGTSLDGNADGSAGDNYVSPADTSPTTPGQLNLFRLFGDINGDGFVNGVDLIAFRSDIGTATGDPTFMAAFDANNDGFINGLDLIRFRNRIGSSVFG